MSEVRDNGDQPLSLLTIALPPWFERRVVTIAVGALKMKSAISSITPVIARPSAARPASAARLAKCTSASFCCRRNVMRW